MEEEKEDIPFVFKTIAGENESRYRGLPQLAEIMEIAYELFLNKFLNEKTGDPFQKYMKDKSFYDTFNRALIETTIAENKFYGEVMFDGTSLTVSSQGIEECLRDLKIIWLITQEMKGGKADTENNFGQPPAIFKINAMGRLFGILQYFLSTSHNLISDIRIRQLEETLNETPDEKRKALLLRYKTDLLKKKYRIKTVKEALLKVIELEVDLIEQLNKIPAPPAGVETNSSSMEARTELPVTIDEDFLYELSIIQFPYKGMVEQNPAQFAELKHQFALLPLKPKLHWYFNEFISDEEWTEHCTGGHRQGKTGSRETVVAPFVPDSDTEVKAKHIINDFNEMIVNDSVDPKYYGRFLKDTELVKTLIRLDEQITEFKKYVFHDTNIDNYNGYAKAATTAILLTLSKLRQLPLKASLFEELLSLSIETDLSLAISLFGQHKNDHIEISRRFKILKVLADEHFINAMESLVRPEIPPRKQSDAPRVTVSDKIKRELDIIATIYQSQYYLPDDQDQYTDPFILDKNGQIGINGQYIQHMDIDSDFELFNIQQFKNHITERYEASSNHTLLLNQLKEIQLKAAITLQYYQAKLTAGNQVVDDFLKDQRRPLKERIDELEKYHALVHVSELRVTSIVFGVERSDYTHYKTKAGGFHYIADNTYLAEICQHILDFIDLFDLSGRIVAKPVIAIAPEPGSLFKDESKAGLYLSALKAVSPPVTDRNGNYILGAHKKGAVTAWMDELVLLGKIDASLSRQRKTNLINELIPDLNISMKSLFNSTGRPHQYYSAEFKKALKEF
ncbi:MAG: hypothetical protein ACYCZO_08075 [Daejeonella sp.]